MSALPSYEHDARIEPNFGCAQATCQTGPVCLQGGRGAERTAGRARGNHPGKMNGIGEHVRDELQRENGTNAPFQDLARAALRLAGDDVEHANGAVGGARRQALAVVVELRVVLQTCVQMRERGWSWSGRSRTIMSSCAVSTGVGSVVVAVGFGKTQYSADEQASNMWTDHDGA
jgi:hypothetical protein